MKKICIITRVMMYIIGLNVSAMDMPNLHQHDLISIEVNARMIVEAKKELRFAIMHHQEEVVKSLLDRAGKCCAGRLMRDEMQKYDSVIFQDAFTETTPRIRDLVIEFAYEDDLKTFFNNTLQRFHEIEKNNQTNPGCYIVCGWLRPVLCYFNNKNSLSYPLSDDERRLLGI